MRSLLAAALLGAGTLALAACDARRGQDAPAETADGSGLSMTNARLILPAVTGNPGAAYFDLANTGGKPLEIAAADVADAGRTEMHDMAMKDGMMSMVQMATVPVPQGASVRFAPGGKHVMAFDLSPELRAGAMTELTLTLANGDKASFPVRVEGAGAAR